MDISIVIPVFKSEDILADTVSSIHRELEDQLFTYEIILVNDGSPDQSWEVASSLAGQTNNVRAINLVKNYGQHTAVLCGIAHGSGKYFITMDDDMQNPPSEILKLYNKIVEGYDLVFAQFEKKEHGYGRGIGTKIIDILNQKLFNKPKNLILTNFRIFTREVAQRVVNYNTFQPYIPGLLLMHATNSANVLTIHHKRAIGKSNYNIRRIVSLVARLLFNYSSYPLKLLSLIGGVVAMCSFFWGLYIIIHQLLVGTSVEGWTTVVVLLAFLNGFIILMLGVLGEYVVRLIRTISTEKSYHIKEIVT
jgi:glycosyltransferase involved in cell wall biosynthesis